MAHHIMSSGRIRLALRTPEGDQDQDNPFAPPPEGTPDRPWQPRQPSGSSGSGGSGSSDGSDGSGGPDSGSGQGSPDGSGSTPPTPPRGAPQAWGSQWSSRQPQGGRPDPYGRRPDPMQGPTGPQGTGPRFDPTDPAHRRSRYALFFGSCGLLFALLGWTPVGLLLGALALYWGISALRMPDEERAQARAAAASALADATQSARPAPPAPGPDAQRSFVTAAWTGIVASGLALVIVAGTYAFHLAYRDYYTCRQDALTTPAAHACQKLLPKPLRDLPSMRP
ncbi:hypothetical protein [Streptomyces sp. NPDC021224]|uniref:hypothetical protein n=1 Tax=unclassified Streptomyces TaxID=2593676 RepID=UPI0037AAC8C4